jgi:hypothetical protein
VDGTTQPGFAGSPLIELKGSNALAGADGVFIQTNGVTVRGFDIDSFPGGNGVAILGNDNIVEGNYIGTDTTGTVALGNLDGVALFDGSSECH